MTEIPIADPQVSEAAKEAVCDVLDSGMLADGAVVREFEAEFAEYVGVDHAIATSSGTTALHAMLEAAGIGDGDVVLTTPFSFIASANAIRHAGAEVAFADVRRDTFNLDPDAVRDVLAERDDVMAIMPVHLYGLPADMGAFRDIAREYGLQLFEDAAQAHGATFDGEMVGSLGDAGAFSFYPTKNMTTGEGGMITTDDDEVADRARRLIDHGRTSRYEHVEIGYNFRMTNVHAAIGREQLRRLPDWIEKRRENARSLTTKIHESTVASPPYIPENRIHAFHQYTITSPLRDHLETRLKEADIGYGIYYPTPISSQHVYDDCGLYPIARELSEQVISVPTHPTLLEADIERIGNTINRTQRES
ncbi:DegT/DnrJ/EryC1/StrS family aminotransferase [Halorientalis salina]|uniref:DegT/DnrJ/EryC1/StrS family aminotransferase n=1 Tax=Halorientalis salina TaxID=2932266 RepID=UPI0010AD5E06|nr:DegT/DnrJ/EryC1/StrS family aminotransferase [Halorientalis salina]